MASFYFTLAVVIVATLLHASHGYVDFGATTLPFNGPILVPTPRPNQLPIDHDFRFEILPSMITAVAPSITIAPNGTREIVYSLYYHQYFSKTRQGRGLFRRGVFANDPPISTCTPCGGAVSSSGPSGTTSSSISCTTHAYLGVFRSPDPQAPSSVCLNSNYTGVFEPGTTSTTGLPCCFTIPASCLANGTSSTSFTATSGVFRPTSTFTSSLYANATTPASTSSRFSLAFESSTFVSLSSSSYSGGPILNSGSRSTTARTTVTVISGTTVVVSTSAVSSMSLTPTTPDSRSSSPSTSNMPYVSSSGSLSTSSPTSSSVPPISSLLSTSLSTISTSSVYSIIVISSTTITLSNEGAATSSSGTTTSQSTLTIITATPAPIITTTLSSSASYITTVVSNTIDGCGTASGSGIVAGTGTIFTEGISIVTSGTASGSASSVVGCGYIIATTGTFLGSAVITGCGYGSGTGTLTGTGTIWPAQGMGMMSIVSSGTISGSGSFRGCGTLTGSGVFTATEGYTTTILAPVITSSVASSTRPTKTVSVFVSYCAGDSNNQPGGGGDIIINIFGNNNTLVSSPGRVSSDGSDIVNISIFGSSSDNALCNVCPNSAGICCPPGVTCDDDDGKCPLYAVERAGNTINGYLIPQVMNSSAPVDGQRRHMARVRVKSREEKERETEMDSKGARERAKKMGQQQRRRHKHGNEHGHGHGHGHGHVEDWEKKMKRKQF
ncbi:hypothetical protein PV08_07098 [Exophiala spinifera]|uniref:Uncharacterized protein n=1 Tax=Exophiala spinifera TaxID=91928 RepID=A0A0D1YH86_9EURO|nr:uncharacterized protein PV08_07098 [Exophiala spinifera]KIW14316.1 hypothetical protein PV08_07098 [Exophiala spinifera]